MINNYQAPLEGFTSQIRNYSYSHIPFKEVLDCGILKFSVISCKFQLMQSGQHSGCYEIHLPIYYLAIINVTDFAI